MVAKVKVLDAERALQLQADLCLDSIDWCNKEKHTFLRQRVEARLASMCVFATVNLLLVLDPDFAFVTSQISLSWSQTATSSSKSFKLRST